MQINYDDERLTEIEEQKNTAIQEVEKTYDDMIGQTGKFYEDQIQANKDWTQQQQQLQKEQTDFAVEKLEQQKEQAQKDYVKEQSGAYKDWKKQSNQYGANAEQMASMGMTGTGFSESSQVAMYNAYQSRVTSARETMAQLNMQFDNAMKEAKMQGNAAMAELALQGYQQQMELALQSFQMGNQLLLDKINQKTQLDNMYYGRQQDMIAQMNQQAATAEQIRQYNEQMAFKQKDYEEGVRQFNEQLAEEKRQFDEQMGLKKGTTAGNGSTVQDPATSQGTVPGEVPQTDSAYDPTKDVELIKMAEAYIGATPDGKWDEKDAKIAKKMQLYHLLDVIDTMRDTGYEMPQQQKKQSSAGEDLSARQESILDWVGMMYFNNPDSIDALIANSDYFKTEEERQYARAAAEAIKNASW